MRKKVIRLTETDLVNLIKKVLNEENLMGDTGLLGCIKEHTKNKDLTNVPESCISLFTQWPKDPSQIWGHVSKLGSQCAGALKIGIFEFVPIARNIYNCWVKSGKSPIIMK
jgi:hypothetical protein